MNKPFIIGSRNTKEMLQIGLEILKDGGSAMDAVEATIKAVEENPLDTGVGLGGIPNLLGVPQMDASIMDGKTLRTGAVAAVEGYLHPISIARKVLDVSPHVLLVGTGAELFARTMGFEKTELLTERSKEIYKAFINEAIEDLDESYRGKETWITRVKNFKLKEWQNKFSAEKEGTVNIIAMDYESDICSGVSTSGIAFKFPGRVGDSPIIGAGNYCDNRIGAAACTGRGELAIRLSTARTIISYMENRMTIKDACVQAMRDVIALNDVGSMNCLACDIEGNTISASINRESIHYYMDVDAIEPEEKIGIWVKEQ